MPFGGDVVFGPGAPLHSEIGGAAAGSQHDQLQIAGDVTLDGALGLALINGYIPPPTQQFTLLTHASRSGTFACITGYTISPSQAFALNYTDTTTRAIAGQWHNPNLSGIIDVPGPKLNVTGSGTWSGTLIKQGAGMMDVSRGASSVAPGTVLDVQGGAIQLATDVGAASANVSIHLTGGNSTFQSTQHLKALIIGAGRLANLAANGSRTLFADELSIASTGGLDLADNDLVVNDGAFTDVQALVLSGFGTATSIHSSTSDGSQILALFDNALVGATDWNGSAIAPDAIVGKYTYFGDANIDGQVTGDDYTVIDANLNTNPASGLEWLAGDTNLDGIVTGDDYTVIDANLGLGIANPLSPSHLTAVPEPLHLGMGVALVIILRRGGGLGIDHSANLETTST